MAAKKLKPKKKSPAKKTTSKKKVGKKKVAKKKLVAKPAAASFVPTVTEEDVMASLNEDLSEAWQKLKAFALELGEQRNYASGRAVMFSKDICYFFVRPHKSFLEVVIFLSTEANRPGFRSVYSVSKTKFAHTFRVVHPDQVEGELTEAVAEAYSR